MTSSIIDKKKIKSTGKLLIFGFFTIVITSTILVYFFLIKPNEWLTQKTKIIEIGTNLQICELVNCTDEVLVAYHSKPTEPYPLGNMDITFEVTKGSKSKDISFTYTIVDTTDPVIEKVNEPTIAIGEEFVLLNYIKVTDNSGENLISHVNYEPISTDTTGDFSVELSVKDSSGNESMYTFEYSIVDLTTIAPDLPGTKEVMQFINGLNRVTYVAEPGNPYGVTAGLYVGEFKKEVTFEGVEVGGVVLIPKVVEKLLADKGGKAIFIPADISEINDKKAVELSFLDATYDKIEYKNLILEINTNGNKVSISNTITNDEVCTQSFVIEGILPDYYYNAFFPVTSTNKYDFSAVGNFIWIRELQEVVPLGKKLTETKGIFGVWLNARDNSDGYISENDILKVENSIIFLKDLD